MDLTSIYRYTGLPPSPLCHISPSHRSVTFSPDTFLFISPTFFFLFLEKYINPSSFSTLDEIFMAINTKSVGAAVGATGADALKDPRPLERDSWGDGEGVGGKQTGRTKDGSQQVRGKKRDEL